MYLMYKVNVQQTTARYIRFYSTFEIPSYAGLYVPLRLDRELRLGEERGLEMVI
jgi:hypothetical protein